MTAGDELAAGARRAAADAVDRMFVGRDEPLVAPAAATITRATLDAAIADMRRADDEAREAAARRASAWSALKLDYAAMDVDEHRLVLMAQGDFVFHPADAKRVDEIVAKYRRDRGGSSYARG